MLSSGRHREGLTALYFEVDHWSDYIETCMKFHQDRDKLHEPESLQEVDRFIDNQLEAFKMDWIPPVVYYDVEVALDVGLNTYITYLTRGEHPGAKLARKFLLKLARRYVRRSLPFEHIDIVIDVLSRNKFLGHQQHALDVLFFFFPDRKRKTLVIQHLIEFIEANGPNRLRAIELLKILLYEIKWTDIEPWAKLVVHKLCAMLSSTKDAGTSRRLQECVLALTRQFDGGRSSTALRTLLVRQASRVSLGYGRSVIADTLYLVNDSLCLGDLAGDEGTAFLSSLLLMMDDIDPDVAIRAFQIAIELVDPRCRRNRKLFKGDDDQRSPFVANFFDERYVDVLRTLMTAYITHSRYPQTLHSIFVLNCLLFMTVKSPSKAKIAVRFTLNLQKATLVYEKFGRKRLSYLLGTVLCLLSLVGSVYSIPGLVEMAERLERSRLLEAPSILPPTRAPPASRVLPDWRPQDNLLVDETTASSIVSRWYDEVTHH